MTVLHDIFIGHATSDQQTASCLKRELEQGALRILDRPVKLYLAHDDVELGSLWQEEIPTAQKNSLITAIVVSADAAKSPYVQHEIMTAITLARVAPDRHRLVPLYREECGIYGAAVFQGTTIDSVGAIREAAVKLLLLVRRMRIGQNQAFLDFGIDEDRVKLFERKEELRHKVVEQHRHGHVLPEDLEKLREYQRQIRNERSLRPGDDLLDGRYLIHQLVGRGGISRVWRAEDSVKTEIVAIRVLDPRIADEDAYLRRLFLRGAELQHRLQCEGAVRVRTAGANDAGWYFSVLDYVEGPSLEEKIRGGGLTTDAVIDIGIKIARTLERVHKEGIVHGDVKPLNILLSTAKGPLLTDFDMAQAPWHTSLAVRDELFRGTRGFSSPEHHGAGALPPQSDIFCLGLTLLYAIIGWRRDWRGPFTDIEPLLLEANLPDALSQVLRRALSKEPTRRQETAAQLAEQLSNSRQSNKTGQLSEVRQGSKPQSAPLPSTNKDRWRGDSQYDGSSRYDEDYEDRYDKDYEDQGFLERVLSGFDNYISGRFPDDDW